MFPVNTIFQENCIDTLHRMDDELIDMTITSPPYDDLRDYNGYHFPVEEIAASLFHKTKQGGVVIWVVADRTVNGDETLSSFKHAFAFKEAGFKVHDTMLYVKRNPIPSLLNSLSCSNALLPTISLALPAAACVCNSICHNLNFA